MVHKPASKNLGQKGFTLIELLVVIMIMGILGGVITEAIYQVSTGSARNTRQMTTLKQVEYAVRWITPDTQMAQSVSGNLTEPGGLSLSWTEWDDTTENVTYTIDNGQLERSWAQNGVLQSTRVVASYIDPARTSSIYAGDGSITFTITSAIGGYKPVSITRSFNLTMRSGTL